ncbi:hypothetical protein F5887DRAFT_981444 [Amanita rubescens]|nr:hypothetical protein F5887DRAFT_981444 [Amanita rubescens]
MEYPGPIPSNTSVPTWAFLNVTATNDNFDPAQASNLAVAPSPTSSASTSSAATSSTSTSSTSTSTSHPTHDTSKVGAIAGGTIGGFIIALLVLTLLFYLHKRRNGTTPAPVPLTERPISMRIVSSDASQELYNTNEISTAPIPLALTRIERIPHWRDEVLSDPRRPSGRSPQHLGTREIYKTGVRSIQTDSGTTWFSE